MILQVSKDELKNALADEKSKDRPSPGIEKPCPNIKQGIIFNPDVAFWSLIATIVVAIIAQVGLQNPQFTTLAAILTAAISSGIQKYEQINNKK
jgi:hypothetical protein